MEAALLKIEGVKKAKVSKEKQSADVSYDGKKTNPQKIVQTFNKNDDGGYKVALPAKKS